MNDRWVDYLRATAVMLVFWRHWLEWRSENFLDNKTLQLVGIYGVVIFFVITSYVLVLSLGRLNGLFLSKYTQFLVRRIFRIYPLSITVVLLAFFLNGTTDTKISLISNLLLVQNFTEEKSIIGPLWTLPIEFQMYLALPIVAALFKSARSFLGLYALMIGIGALFIWKKSVGTEVITWAPVFLVGAACAIFGKKIKISAPLVLVFFVGSFLSYLWLGRFSQTAGSYLPAILLAVPLLAKNVSGSKRGDGLVNYLSKVSYGVYLFHGIILMILHRYAEINHLEALTIYVAGTFALATLSHNYLEQPMIEYGKSIAQRVAAIGAINERRRIE